MRPRPVSTGWEERRGSSLQDVPLRPKIPEAPFPRKSCLWRSLKRVHMEEPVYLKALLFQVKNRKVQAPLLEKKCLKSQLSELYMLTEQCLTLSSPKKGEK